MVSEQNISKYITILMPCKDQKEGFLRDSINSVIAQTSPDWRLLVIIDEGTPSATKDIIGGYLSDSRIRMLYSGTNSLAGALNTGMKSADTEFVCSLLSDDRFDKNAIAVLRSYIEKYPDIDFFYSSRRLIDSHGDFASPVMPSREFLSVEDFKISGSRVKHLLCWRREKGVAVGGVDEELTQHGCDDYDFPWKMAEAGAKFKNIKECLYYYREHRDAARLTTDVPISRQVEIIKKMFKKHGVPAPETEAYVKRALKGYLIQEKMFGYEFRGDVLDIARMSYFREISERTEQEFISKGYSKKWHFFPHRAYYLQRCGPDELKLARKMCGIKQPNKFWQINLHAYGEYINEFPKELFFDKDVIWHQQHFGRVGHVALAYIAVEGHRLYGLNYVSDLVQRISRDREHKTRIESQFRGWNHMLLNDVLNFAIENNIKTFYSPTADLVMKNSDPARHLERELFERVYDRTVAEHFQALKSGKWWVIDVEKNRGRAVIAEKKYEIAEFSKTICLCHDIEKGLGHLDVDPSFAGHADEVSVKNIDKMLAAEKAMNIKATYNVAGLLFNELKERIEKGGHCLGFHSYDHKTAGFLPLKSMLRNMLGLPVPELYKLRDIDYRIRGYRPPRSKLTPDICDRNLCYYNFDWLASSAGSLGLKFPTMQNRIVKIPVLFDDYDLYKKKTGYEEWESRALDAIRKNYFVAFSLHDCYAEYWLPHYGEFLKKISALGEFMTLDEVADKVILGNSE